MIYFFCFLLSFLCAWGVSRYAQYLRLIDVPSRRSSHFVPTPKGGGAGLLVVFMLVSTIATPWFFWLTAAALSLLSFLNDISELSPKTRLFVQGLGAIILLSGFYMVGEWKSNFFTFIESGFFLLFIVATTNCYNFMDGINGIAGLMGLVGFGLLGVYLHPLDSSLSMVSFALVAGCAGFLPFNIPSAKVFMGDVGSILLGYVFSSIVVFSAADLLEFTVMTSFLMLFYLDEISSIYLRLKKKRSLLEPHRWHLYQVLANEVGLAHWKISAGYALIQLIVGLITLHLQKFGLFWLSVFIVCISSIYLICDLYIKRKYQIS